MVNKQAYDHLISEIQRMNLTLESNAKEITELRGMLAQTEQVIASRNKTIDTLTTQLKEAHAKDKEAQEVKKVSQAKNQAADPQA